MKARRYSAEWLTLTLYFGASSGIAEAQAPAPTSYNVVTATDAAGNLYAAASVTDSAGVYVQTSKAGPKGGAPFWTATVRIGTLSLPGAIAVDGTGGVYVAIDDASVGADVIVKFASNGVFVSSQPVPYQGNPFMPYVTGLAVDVVRLRLYASETFSDPNRGGLTSILASAYDLSLNLLNTQTLTDTSGISDESSGIAVNAVGDVIVGVSQWGPGASGNPTSYQLAVFSPNLEALLSRTASGPFDPRILMYFIGLSGFNQSGPPNSTLPQPFVAQALFYGGGPMDASWNLGFYIQSSPDGAAGQSLSPASVPDASGDFSATLTLGSSTGPYIVAAYCPACYPLTQAIFTATATVSAAQPLLSISTGDMQIGIVGSSVTTPLTVLVQTASSVPVVSAGVGFAVSSAPAGALGFGVSPTSPMTGSNGKASTVLTLGNVPADYYVSCNCPNCDSKANSVSFHACAELANDNFSQFDTRWSTYTYGVSTYTIRNLGCGLTALATLNNYYHSVDTDVATTNPGTLDGELVADGGFRTFQGAARQTVLVWNTIEVITSNHIMYRGREDVSRTSQAAVLANASQDVLANRPILFEVNHVYPDGHASTHFILAVGKCGNRFVVSDPAGARVLYDPNDPTYTLLGSRRFFVH